MDKKILLGGAAALLLGAGLFAAPASAAIEISHSGEAVLTATMTDACSVRATGDIKEGQVGAAGTGVVVSTTASAADCGTAGEESPIWDVTSKLDWSASGTLANGLSVSTSQDGDLNLSGAFGSLGFKKGGDSAAKGAMVNSDGAIDVAGEQDLGGHSLATAGTAGVVVNYAAPTMGGMNLLISYAPNSNIAADGTPAALDNAEFTDTIGFGANFAAGDLSISAGWESADSVGASCATGVITAATLATDTLIEQADKIGGADICGDQTLMMLGAKMAVGDMTINGGWSELDSEEADRSTYNIGLGMNVGDYALNVDYVNATLTYDLATLSDKQTVIGVGASTSLGDGVTLGLNFSNNSYNLVGLGAHTNYRAHAELKAVY